MNNTHILKFVDEYTPSGRRSIGHPTKKMERTTQAGRLVPCC